MGKRPFVRFYQQDWACDKFVRSLNMEERGTYFTLLVRQMIDGYIDDNPAELMIDLKAPTLEEAQRLLSPKIMDKFKPYPDAPHRLFNQRLKDVIEEQDASRVSGSTGGQKKVLNSGRVETTSGSVEDAIAAEQFDFGPIIREMPRRRVNGNVEGWELGVNTLKYITTREEYNLLLDAVRNYARSRRGQDPTRHIRFDNFVNGRYKEFVSAERLKQAESPVEDTAKTKKIEVVEQAFEDTDAKIKHLRSQKNDISPPWWPKPLYSEEKNKEVAASWSEEDRANWLRRLLAGENVYE